MKKRIQSKDQTRELRKATLGLLNRNKTVKERFEKLVQDKEGVIPRDVLENALVRPAVRGFRFRDVNDFPNVNLDDSGSMFYGGLYETEMIDPEKALKLLTDGEPEKTLLVGVDLGRSKEAIMSEFEALLDLQREKRERRLKWLSKWEEIIAVWDAWVEGGEPARQAFPKIAKRYGIKESTVKERWYRAYELIYKKPYETDPSKRRKARQYKAMEMLCLKCTNPICQNKHGGEEIGCPAYIKMAGRSDSRERTFEKLDILSDRQSYESYINEDDQE